MTDPRSDDCARARHIFIGLALAITLALCWATLCPIDRRHSEGAQHQVMVSPIAQTRTIVQPGAVAPPGLQRARLSTTLESSRSRAAIAAALPYPRQARQDSGMRLVTNDLDRYSSRYIRQTTYRGDIGPPRDSDARIPLLQLQESTGPADVVATIIEPDSDLGPGKKPDGQRQAKVTQVMSDLSRMDFDKALDAATKMTEANPNDPTGYNLQGGAYLGKRDYASARKSFEKALSLQPTNSEALLYLAQLDVQQNAFASAQKRYQAMLAKDPKNIDAMIGMAQMEAHRNNEKAQLAWLEKAKVARPEAATPRVFLGAYYLRAKNNPKALKELTDALRFDAANPDALDLLGQAQLADGQKSQAVQTYQKLASVRPESPVAQLSPSDRAGQCRRHFRRFG